VTNCFQLRGRVAGSVEQSFGVRLEPELHAIVGAQW